MTEFDQKRLGKTLWNIADQLCGSMNDDPNGTVYKRVLDLMSRADYSLYEPREMMPENKEHFRRVLKQFLTLHPFSPALFPTPEGN